MKFTKNWAVLIALGIACTGCQKAPESPQVTEEESLQLPANLAISEKQLEEPLSEDEVQCFIELVRRFPAGKLPELSPVTVPDHGKPETVQAIVEDARQAIRDSLTVDTLQKGWAPKTSIRRIMQDEQISSREMLSLMLRLSCAVAADAIGSPRTIRAQQVVTEEKLNDLVEKIAATQRAGKPISDSMEESLREVASMAEYLSILSQVPVASLTLVHEHQGELETILPTPAMKGKPTESREELRVTPVNFERFGSEPPKSPPKR